MKAKVDPDLCIGCTLCVQTSPEVFRMEEDKAIVHTSLRSPRKLKAVVSRLLKERPTTAIVIEE
jgi:ferredoxin